MKLLKITFLMTVCLYIIISHYNYVNAAYSISIDRSNYIKAQLDLRNAAINQAMEDAANNINEILDSSNDVFLGISTLTNTFAGFLGLFTSSISFGSAGLISSMALGFAQTVVDGSQPGDIGYTIVQGVKSLIREELSSFKTQSLVTNIKSLRQTQANFYKGGAEFNATAHTAYFIVHDRYSNVRHEFEEPDYLLDSVGLYAIFANAHLLFLNDMVLTGAEKYKFTPSNVQTFIGLFEEYKYYYANYFKRIDILGRQELENAISGYANQDEWNKRNEYYNFMKLYVFDIVHYWDYLHPVSFPKGVYVENAHVTLSNLFGAPYNGNYHFISSNIDSYLEGKKAYQYQGKLTGIYYKNYKCWNSDDWDDPIYLPKYFGGKQYSFRDQVERNSFFLGDTGSTVPLQYKAVNSLQSVIQYNARDGQPFYEARDYFWGLDAAGTSIGNTQDGYYKTKQTISYDGKVAALALPLSYNECSVPCSGSQGKVYLVESAVMGFVNSDVTDDNLVFEFTSSMIDAQKYTYLYPSEGSSYTRDGYERYRHSMYIQAFSKITYKVKYSPYNKLPGTFRLFLDFKSDIYPTSKTVVQVFNTESDFECIKSVLNVQSNGLGVQDIGTITLNPDFITDNYITLEFSSSVYLQSLVFKAIE